ncbi:MAG: FG-GAP-like repeat-containing protein [Rubricoccaceae bacterium]|nr:FG-GAP-like repeat-containing protein [Rubricoccaceae bacterium]
MRFLFALAALALATAPARAQSDASLLDLATPNPEFAGSYGAAVAGVGDLDGDGAADLLVGAPFEDGGGLLDAGRAYVYSGATGAQRFVLTSPQATFLGNFGDGALGPGDLNGDGVPDLLVAASGETPAGQPAYAGRVHALSGADGTALYAGTSTTPSEFGGYGASLALAGDLDGDGVTDVFVGAPTEDVDGMSSVGRAYAFSGADGAPIRTYTSPTPEALGRFGASVAGAGDLDGDGVPDLLVGTVVEDDGDLPFAGRAHLLSGATGARLFTFASPDAQEGGLFGSVVAGGADLSGDGVPDLLLGAPEETPQGSAGRAGRVYVFSGADGALLRALVAPDGGDPDGQFGLSIAVTDDLDGDGTADLLIAAPQARPGASAPSTGRAYTFSGADGRLLFTLKSPGEQRDSSSLFGGALASVGDVDGDGVGELFLGAPVEFSGRAYLFSGNAAPAGLTLTATNLTPLDVPPGGSIRFQVTVANAAASPATLDLWADAERPAPVTLGPFRSGILPEGRTVTTAFTQRVPPTASPGVYTYTVQVGRFPASAVASESFTVTVTGAPSPEREVDWATPAADAWKAPAAGGATDASATQATGLVTVSPNPLRQRATLTFETAEATPARLAVYDALGREVAVLLDGVVEAGRHTAPFDARALPAGVYLWRLATRGGVETGRLTVVR